MPSFNEQIKKISLTEVLFVIVFSYLIIFSLEFFGIIAIDTGIINLIVILFFAFSLRNYCEEFKSDVSGIFSVVSFREILIIVLLNIFFSYGMLYLSNYVVQLFPTNGFLSYISSRSINSGLAGAFSLVSIILLSPVSEELLFRGVFLNKLRLIVPMFYAIIISSLFFALLHSFGSILSAFVFGICMAVLYLKTDNILVPILAHFINNLLSEAIYHFDYWDLLFSDAVVMVLMSGLAVISFVVLYKFIRLNLKNI